MAMVKYSGMVLKWGGTECGRCQGSKFRCRWMPVLGELNESNINRGSKGGCEWS